MNFCELLVWHLVLNCQIDRATTVMLLWCAVGREDLASECDDWKESIITIQHGKPKFFVKIQKSTAPNTEVLPPTG